MLVTLFTKNAPCFLADTQEKREATRLGLVIVHGSVEFCEATPIDLVDEPKKSLYGRGTDRDLRSA